ncbi:hypothetical protein [Paenibacillus contaminans]|uniref:hypothetical protein n=1 Tax=Paenibacillus contaminans TaxID=450362 RepID=UPI0011BE52F7|nr:hypothetical protein [Paenibacillus contaminans]
MSAICMASSAANGRRIAWQQAASYDVGDPNGSRLHHAMQAIRMAAAASYDVGDPHSSSRIIRCRRFSIADAARRASA